MRRDPKAFRERFAAWKNGEQVYDAGRIIDYAKGKDAEYWDTVKDFVSQHEGFKDTTYLDGKGIPTIGYGFTDTALTKRGKISRAEADKYLINRLRKEDQALRDSLSNWDLLGTDAKKALISYRYNYPAGFKDTTKFMKYWNAGDYMNAIKEVDAGWNDTANPGLRTRRMAEQELLRADPFLSGKVNASAPIEDPANPTFSKPVPPLDFTAPRISTSVNQPFRRVAADNKVNSTAGWKALNHFETLDILKNLSKGYGWKLPKLPPLFPLDVNQWTKSLIGYRGGKDSLPGYTTGEDGGFLNWLKNAVIGASVADAPAVATASGWHNENGQWVLNRTAADELLGENMSVLSTFSPTHPLTAATEKALLVAGRTLKILKGPFVADIMDIETPIAPNIDQLKREALKDYTMAGGGKRFNELLYQNYLRGYDVPGLRVNTPRAKKDVPEEMVKIYKNSVEPRLKAQREWMNAEDISRGIDNALNEGYSVYDDAIFNRAGHPDWEKGFYNPKTGRISIRKGYEDFAVGHEVRHRVDDMRVPLVESEENLLNASFTDDFKNLSNVVEELKGVNMSEEMVTTNFDGRKKLLGKDTLKRVSVSEQNKMIDEATYDEMVESMEKANGYGKRYVEALISKYGRIPDKLIKAWKESYKHVGMLTGTAAVTKTKKKQLK